MSKIRFAHPDGSLYDFPSTREEAEMSKTHWLLDSKARCPKCHSAQLVHLETGNCRFCRTQELVDKVCHEGLPQNATQAVAARQMSYFSRKMCFRGDHLFEPGIHSRQCQACRRERLKLTDNRQTDELPGHNAPQLTRDQARSLGFTHYTPATPCRRGHTTARYTSTGNCIACLRGNK